MIKHEEDVQRSEPDCGNCEEIDGPGYIQMVSEKWQPCCGLFPRTSGLDRVLPDCVLAWRVILQEQEGLSDRLGSPQRIVLAQLSDQVLHLLGDGWPTSSAARLPSPEERETSSVPFHDCGGLHHMRAVFPLVQEARYQDPQQSETACEARPGILLLINAMLAESQLAF